MALAPFAGAIFLSAFLLFLVQPLIARHILPWFGGAPTTWTACMIFFQVSLVGGYAYAHWLAGRRRLTHQLIIHGVLIALALLFLPIVPAAAWQPEPSHDPVWRILLLLAATVGLPYFVLAANGPLLQAWLVRIQPGARNPYRLFALSNLGSLLALAAYPFLMEPWLGTREQGVWWSAGFGLFALTWASCAIVSQRGHPSAGAPAAADSGSTTAHPAPSRVVQTLWLALTACASTLLLAVTNKICLDIAVIPFLWVLPLAVYLVTFIICFERPHWYRRPVFGWLAVTGGLILAAQAQWSIVTGVMPQVVFYVSLLFVGCMLCHGETSRLRPAPAHLTRYYLMIAVGGATGGLFVGLVAPVIFSDYHELPIAFVLTGVLALGVALPGRRQSGARLWNWQSLGVAGLILLLSAVFVRETERGRAGAISTRRSFYGVVSTILFEGRSKESRQQLFYYGSTIHGSQFMVGPRQKLPTLYYGTTTGLGQLLLNSPKQQHRHIGIVGLGIGTISAYAGGTDRVRYYEINPQVEEVARSEYLYLTNCAAPLEVVPGDARLSLQREPDNDFDVLVLDAFSNDAVPIHLLTREAFDIYRRHVRDDGAIIVHATNRSLDILPVVRRHAHALGWSLVVYENENDLPNAVVRARWLILTSNQEVITALGRERENIPESAQAADPYWTDERHNLFEILR